MTIIPDLSCRVQGQKFISVTFPLAGWVVGSYKLAVLQLDQASQSPRVCSKQSEIAQPIPRVSGSVDLKWDLRACITNRLLGSAEAAALEPHFEEIKTTSQ